MSTNSSPNGASRRRGYSNPPSPSKGSVNRKLSFDAGAASLESLRAAGDPSTPPEAAGSSALPKYYEGEYFNMKKFEFWKYIKTELLSGQVKTSDTDEAMDKDNTRNFFRVPYVLEKYILLGCWMCLDTFLHTITYLPIRVCIGLVYLCKEVYVNMTAGLGSSGYPRDRKPSGLHRAHLYDLMRGSMLVIGCLVLNQINMSRVYHSIRGQNMIKLYVLTSMLEVIDKLFGSFGQDAFKALHDKTRSSFDVLNVLLAYIVTTSYVVLHSSLYFFQIATLTVAINSSDQSLLTVLVLNNFQEMKSFVFKKFDRHQLFQLACGDITERFQLLLFFSIIIMVAVLQAEEDSMLAVFYSFAPFFVLMVLCESVADCIKHAFVNRHNQIDAGVYHDYSHVLREDILGIQKGTTTSLLLDRTHNICTRVGLAQIPLACVSFRYLLLGLSSPVYQTFIEAKSKSYVAAFALLLFLAAMVVKIVLGVCLVWYSAYRHNSDLIRIRAVTKKSDNAAYSEVVKKKRVDFIDELHGMQRYMVHKGRVVA